MTKVQTPLLRGGPEWEDFVWLEGPRKRPSAVAPRPTQPDRRFAALPPELLLGVFEHLGVSELAKAALVCRAWWAVSADRTLWRTLFLVCSTSPPSRPNPNPRSSLPGSQARQKAGAEQHMQHLRHRASGLRWVRMYPVPFFSLWLASGTAHARLVGGSVFEILTTRPLMGCSVVRANGRKRGERGSCCWTGGNVTGRPSTSAKDRSWPRATARRTRSSSASTPPTSSPARPHSPSPAR